MAAIGVGLLLFTQLSASTMGKRVAKTEEEAAHRTATVPSAVDDEPSSGPQGQGGEADAQIGMDSKRRGGRRLDVEPDDDDVIDL